MIAFILINVLLLSGASGLDVISELVNFKLNLNESSSKNINEECQIQMNLALNALENYEEWPWTMIDASSKIPTGILYGNIMDLGNFDQCVAIEHKIKETVIRGKHCAMGVSVPLSILGNRADTLIHVHQEENTNVYIPKLIQREEEQALGLMLSICIPNACQATDMEEYFGLTGLQFLDTYCQTSDKPDLNGGDIAVITFLAIILCFLVSSTIYDVYLHKVQQTSPHPLLLVFSVLSNGKKLLAVTRNDNQLNCLHGIRFISMMWVVVGHRFALYQAIPVTNGVDIIKWMNSLYSQYIQSAHSAVDTFFFLSGMMISYGYFKTIDKPKSITYVPMLYLHRLLRITPAVAVVYFVYITIFRYVGSGPLWEMVNTDPCYKWWWTFYLYVQNYVNYDDLCIIPTWYLSADMQLFFISPLIVMPLGYVALRTTKKTVYGLCGLLVAAFTFIPFVINFYTETDNIYMTHERLAVWMIGITTGIVLEEVKTKKIKVKINSVLNVLTWVIVLAGMIAIVLTMHDVRYNIESTKTNVFDTFHRVGWGLGLAWIICSCTVGYGGFINSFLSYQPFQVLSRLCYSMYLVHFLVIIISAMPMRTPYYFTDYNVYYQWCGDFITTVLIAVVWVLAFESPMIILEKFIFAAPKPKAPSSEQTKNVATISLPKV